jgi:hypothetical protein
MVSLMHPTLLVKTSTQTVVRTFVAGARSLMWTRSDIPVACPDDERVNQLIYNYDCVGISNRETISRMLKAEHGIQMRYAMYLLICLHI